MVRRAARVDDNHAEIREVFRKAGFAVADTAGAGNGFPDLVVQCHHAEGAYGRLTLLIEVKDGSKAKSRQALTEAQKAFHSNFHVITINSIESALDLITEIRRGP